MILNSSDPASAGVALGADSLAASPLRSVGVEPITSPESFKSRAYAALKDVIVSMDVYRSRADIRLDERRLALDFGISRTPVREAMRDVIEMITAWAALESMAARLITENASAEEIATLRRMFTKFENGEP